MRQAPQAVRGRRGLMAPGLSLVQDCEPAGSSVHRAPYVTYIAQSSPVAGGLRSLSWIVRLLQRKVERKYGPKMINITLTVTFNLYFHKLSKRHYAISKIKILYIWILTLENNLKSFFFLFDNKTTLDATCLEPFINTNTQRAHAPILNDIDMPQRNNYYV